MKLHEIYTYKIEIPWYLYYELQLTDEFTQRDGADLVDALVPKIGRGRYTKGRVDYTEKMWYKIVYPTLHEAMQGEKTLRRRSRGKPRFNPTFVTLSQAEWLERGVGE